MRRLAKTMDVTATRVHVFVSEQVWPQLQLAVFLLGELYGLTCCAAQNVSHSLGLQARALQQCCPPICIAADVQQCIATFAPEPVSVQQKCSGLQRRAHLQGRGCSAGARSVQHPGHVAHTHVARSPTWRPPRRRL